MPSVPLSSTSSGSAPSRLLGSVGARALRFLSRAGRMGMFLGRMVGFSLTPPLKFSRLVRRIHFVGFESILVVMLTGGFTGMVLSLQGFYALSRFGSDAFLGPLVALSLVRELGPVIAALMVAGRAGSAITAEIGIMRNSQQLDALELMGLNPFRYVVVPNFLAALISMPILACLFDVVGIWGGHLVGVKLLGVSGGTYMGEIATYLEMKDIMGGIYKAISFGGIIAWVSCYKGYYTQSGAEGVSRATTQAVVMSSVLILVWDYFMTSAMF